MLEILTSLRHQGREFGEAQLRRELTEVAVRCAEPECGCSPTPLTPLFFLIDQSNSLPRTITFLPLPSPCNPGSYRSLPSQAFSMRRLSLTPLVHVTVKKRMIIYCPHSGRPLLNLLAATGTHTQTL